MAISFFCVVKQQLGKLNLKVGTAIQPVFVSRKLNEDLKVQEAKPSIINQQCVLTARIFLLSNLSSPVQYMMFHIQSNLP